MMSNMGELIEEGSLFDVSLCELPFNGVVTKIVADKNYGILTTTDGLEIYFLRTSVLHGLFDALRIGGRVYFNLCSCELGLQARQLMPLYDANSRA